VQADRWRRIDELLDETLDLEPERRAHVLEAACGADERLRHEVNERLEAYDRAGRFLAEPALQVAAREIVRHEHHSLVGRQLGRYCVLRLIGSGGMGAVYLARDTQLNRQVAIKVLLGSLTQDPDRLQRFEMEARAASALNHPNVMTVFDIDSCGHARFIVTEFVDGQTLRERLHHGPLAAGEAIAIAAQVAGALAAAHRAGLVHRDIKPENIALRRDGLVKVLDFGLAKLIESDEAGSTGGLLRQASGTPHYMSPEQARGEHVDARSDIFSLGATLYEMVTGARPFEGDTVREIIAAILERAPRPLGNRVRSAASALQSVVDQALAKDPALRYSDVQELQADLRAMLLEIEQQDNRRKGTRVAAITMPASLALTHPPNNLTSVASPLIGRESEIAEIEMLLEREDVRLLTLTGVGGTGKTRLAHAVARRMLSRYRDGAFFIELASIHDRELLAFTIAQPLGVKEAGGRCIADCLKDHLRQHRMLLVLDNFEQILSAAAFVADLLASCPRLQVLVTSRARLHLSQEHEFIVQPLALAPVDARCSSGDVMEYPAIRLFVDRAQAVKQTFALTDENALTVADVCARLDGLPLAIELAAARVRVLSPQAIRSRLEHRLQLLTGGARDVPERQQTMRATVEWSFQLLDTRERRLFGRLAVFAGGFTLEAAETVCAEGPADRRAGVLDGIASLVDNSLLVQTEQPDGECRFRLLEVVREYALEALEASEEAHSRRETHARYFLALAEDAEPHLLDTNSVRWLDRLEHEHDNLRAALQWSIENDPATALRLSGAIQYFWLFHGHLTEGRKWLETAVRRSPPGAGARPKALFGAGQLARIQGDYRAAYEFYRESLAASTTSGDTRQIALSSEGLGSVVAYLHGDSVAARALFKEGLSIGRELDDERVIATSLNNLAELERAAGRYREARPLYEEALSLHLKKGDKEGESICLSNLGSLAWYEEDLAAARSLYTRGLEAAVRLANRIDIAISLGGFAAILGKLGQFDEAVQLAGASDRLRESIGCELETEADRLFHAAYMSRLRDALSEVAFTAAYEDGRALKTEEAIALALHAAADNGRERNLSLERSFPQRSASPARPVAGYGGGTGSAGSGQYTRDK
jgi:non-specific serine/threonine protein kinase